MSIGRTFDFTMEIVSPVHIGAGRAPLIKDLDFVNGQQIHFIDLPRVLEEKLARYWIEGADVPTIPQLLKSTEYADYALYSLDCPKGVDEIDKIGVCTKDVFNQPYIPGSSIKGAIRTAIAWKLQSFLQSLGKAPKICLDGKRASADDKLMGDLLGRDPHHDLLRSLQVGDTDSVTPEGGLNVCLATVYTLSNLGKQMRLFSKGNRFRSWVETLRPKTCLKGTLRLDDFLLAPQQDEELKFQGKGILVENFFLYCNAFAQKVIANECEFYGTYGVPEVKEFYEGLQETSSELSGKQECLLQISWGAGWLSKTIGVALTPEELESIRAQYGLGRKGVEIFPKSRRLVEIDGVPVMPLGWVKLKLDVAEGNEEDN